MPQRRARLCPDEQPVHPRRVLCEFVRRPVREEQPRVARIHWRVWVIVQSQAHEVVQAVDAHPCRLGVRERVDEAPAVELMQVVPIEGEVANSAESGIARARPLSCGQRRRPS